MPGAYLNRLRKEQADLKRVLFVIATHNLMMNREMDIYYNWTNCTPYENGIFKQNEIYAKVTPLKAHKFDLLRKFFIQISIQQEEYVWIFEK